MALPRGARPSSTHQWVGSSTSHQGAYKSLLDNFIHQEADWRSKNYNQPCSLQKRNLNHSKLDKMRQQMHTTQKKEEDKTEPQNNN